MRGEERMKEIIDKDGMVIIDDDRRESESMEEMNRLKKKKEWIVELELREEESKIWGIWIMIDVERLGVLNLKGEEEKGIKLKRIDEERIVLRDEEEKEIMGGIELGEKERRIVLRREGRIDGKRSVGERIEDMGEKVMFNGICIDEMRGKLGKELVRKLIEKLFKWIGWRRIEREKKRIMESWENIGKKNEIGGKKKRNRMKKNVINEKRIGKKEGMLKEREEEKVERIESKVIEEMEGNFIDRIKNIGEGNENKKISERIRREKVEDIERKWGEELEKERKIEWMVMLREEDWREKIRKKIEKNEIGVGKRKREKIEIEGGEGIWERRIRKEEEEEGLVMKDRKEKWGESMDKNNGWEKEKEW